MAIWDIVPIGACAMASYGQFCPIAKAADLFCERWTALIIRDLAAGATRFSELQRGVPTMSPTLLSTRLKRLQAEGIVEMRLEPNRRGHTYHLTRAGVEFVPIVHALGVWGQRWTRRSLEAHEIDLGLLIWALERGVNPDAFATHPVTVRLELVDQPAGKRYWWFVNEPHHCQLCLEDPGFEVALYLACTLVDITAIVVGDLPISRALATDRLEAFGARAVVARIERWFNLGPLAKIESQLPPDRR
jgi:DNA-binding HxlR family transcriptional regulator